MHIWVALLSAAIGFAAGWLTAPFAWRYYDGSGRLGIAVVAAVVCGPLGWRFGAHVQLIAFGYLGVIGTLLAFIDVAVKRLPDPFTLPSYLVGAALLGIAIPFTRDGGRHFGYALIGLAALWLVYGIQHFFAPSAIGRGDVKLAGVLGLYLGWLGQSAWVLGLVAGFLLGGLYAVGLLVTRKAGRKSEIPFGPFMLAGTLVGILAQ